jgi:hypothetical protein
VTEEREQPDDLDERLARLERLDRLYAEAERKNEVRKTATVRRGPTSLIAVLLGVALVVGITAAVDLRRLQTPQGTALAWTGAAVFGDCTAYRELTAGLRDDDVDDAEQCRELRRLSEAARDRPTDVALDVVDTDEDDERASATVRARLPGREDEVDVVLTLVPHRGGWQVQRTDEACAVFACP